MILGKPRKCSAYFGTGWSTDESAPTRVLKGRDQRFCNGLRGHALFSLVGWRPGEPRGPEARDVTGPYNIGRSERRFSRLAAIFFEIFSEEVEVGHELTRIDTKKEGFGNGTSRRAVGPSPGSAFGPSDFAERHITLYGATNRVGVAILFRPRLISFHPAWADKSCQDLTKRVRGSLFLCWRWIGPGVLRWRNRLAGKALIAH